MSSLITKSGETLQDALARSAKEEADNLNMDFIENALAALSKYDK